MFAHAVEITGVVLTKLDGTARAASFSVFSRNSRCR
jgi:signal recognition particle GTPase